MWLIREIPIWYLFQYGERVLNEDRSKDFKHYDTRDSQFTLRKMREHVGRCVCGFLNSQQSGMLLIGITEDGKILVSYRTELFHLSYLYDYSYKINLKMHRTVL